MTSTSAVNTSEDYRVNLEVFSGPLDLLLYLIRTEEVSIYDIPIARITHQYLRYVEMMKILNLEIAGEFILMAATLIRIKTRLLLPKDDSESDEPDPCEELIMALVEYKKFKEAGEILRERALLEERVYTPPPPIDNIEGRVELTPMTSLYDLLIAFRETLTAKRGEVVHEVNTPEVTIEDRMTVVLSLLNEKEFVSFTELFADIPRKIVAVVTLVAILELAKARRINLYQAVPFSEVRIGRAEQFNAVIENSELAEVAK